MRWYIKDYTLDKLSSLIAKIDANTLSKQSSDMVYLVSPDEGVYCIQNNVIYKIHYDSKFVHFFFNDAQLICQSSDPIKEEIVSRIPIKYDCFNHTLVKYAIFAEPHILLCIDYCEGNVISDFYFEVTRKEADKFSLIELINDSKKDINGFLSLLN